MFHLETFQSACEPGPYIALEFAALHARGCLDRVNRAGNPAGYDAACANAAPDHLARGIEYKFNCPSTRCQARGWLLRRHLDGKDPICADVVLVATGRRPNVAGLGLESAGIELGTRGEIVVDAHNQTSCPSIYAVGDVTDRVQLTPVAIREGQAFADTVFGNNPRTIDLAHPARW